MPAVRTERDRYVMSRALVEARKGLGMTQPNPLVGAVVLDKDEKVIATGYHSKSGEDHAEACALKKAGLRARGGTLYVTLEPCDHQGKTPPCTNAILESAVGRVVIACPDPNPLVNGKGISKLTAAGLDVVVGCLEKKATQLNEPFFTKLKKGRPLVTAKVAISLDGKIGISANSIGSLGDRRIYLSGAACEKVTMRLRAEAGAIVVGANTVLSDDPLLTVRGKYKGRLPIRAIVDGRLRVKPGAKIFSTGDAPTWIFCSEKEASEPEGKKKRLRLEKAGAQVFPMPHPPESNLSIRDVIRKIGNQGVTAVLVEGGRDLLSQFRRESLIDRWIIYLTPHVLGDQYRGQKTVSLFAREPFPLRFHSVIRRGADWEIVALP